MNGQTVAESSSRSKARSKRSQPLASASSKTLFTPVFYDSSEPGPSSRSSNDQNGLQGASSNLSDATMKRLQELSRMHVALSQSVPEVPASDCGSPRPSTPPGKEKARELSPEALDDLRAGIESPVAQNPRIRNLRKKIVAALEDCNYDSSNGKWAILPSLVKIGVISGGARWVGARGDDPKGTTSIYDNVEWCNAETEEEWFQWERKFENEMKLRSRVERWKQGIVAGAPEDEEGEVAVAEESMEQSSPQDVSVEAHDQASTKTKDVPAQKKGKAPATVASKRVVNRKSLIDDPLKSSSPLGFAMGKRSAAARLAASKPPLRPIPTNPSDLGDQQSHQRNTQPDRTTQERAASANNFEIPVKRIGDLSTSDFSFHPPSFPSSQLVTSTPKQDTLGVHVPPPPSSSPLPPLTSTPALPASPKSQQAHLSPPQTPRRSVGDASFPITNSPSSPSVIRTYGKSTRTPLTPQSGSRHNLDKSSSMPVISHGSPMQVSPLRKADSAVVGALQPSTSPLRAAFLHESVTSNALGKRKLDELASPGDPDVGKKARLDNPESRAEESAALPADESQFSQDPWPVTPRRDSMPQFIDLLASAKKDKQKRRQKAKAKRKSLVKPDTTPAVPVPNTTARSPSPAPAPKEPGPPPAIDSAPQEPEESQDSWAIPGLELAKKPAQEPVEKEGPPATPMSPPETPKRPSDTQQSKDSLYDSPMAVQPQPQPQPPPEKPVVDLQISKDSLYDTSSMAIAEPNPTAPAEQHVPVVTEDPRPPVASTSSNEIDLDPQESRDIDIDLEKDVAHQRDLDLELQHSEPLPLELEDESRVSQHPDLENHEAHLEPDDDDEPQPQYDLGEEEEDDEEEEEPEEHLDVVVPVRDHELERLNRENIYTFDDDEDSQSVYAVDVASDVDLESPTKSLSSLAGSDSEDEEDEQGKDALPTAGDRDPFAFDGEFDPLFTSTQQQAPPGLFPSKTSFPTTPARGISNLDKDTPNQNPAAQALSRSRSIDQITPTPSPVKGHPPSSGYGYGFVGGYNSQFDVKGRVEEVERLLEKDVNFGSWLKSSPEDGEGEEGEEVEA
ncbi:hypothetical protein CC1G_14037 [Coprinopsis cinerea okayama7|uniref:Uncharacterized protein n=1 Tax=Coprinopsis cinerea (strain Okayama-7 / 130 / ATCC MYA-4618 / FGSC 9003) TaxID=240176 RepID=D6RKV1_COPC7|nr:hypothetical protein CC1G_14037 [Coprinopsis cinerea okayama7\|eukprot:XP_002911999.1 hypothetical protein CC1G_14037 [Coprinopsis cinerea okayama7\